MPFIEDLPTWYSPGQKPPESKMTEGWHPKDHPPADWLNWLYTTCYKALYELQQNALHKDQKADAEGLASLIDGKVPLSQLGNITTSAQMKKITRDDGGAVISLSNTTDDLLAAIVAAGTGMNSIYCNGTAINTPPSNKSVRGISFLSGPTYGFVMAVDSDEKIFVNHLDNGTWKGWVQQATTATATTSTDGLMSKGDKAKLDAVGTMPLLWEGAMFVHDKQTVTPTKTLSNCRTGWVLVWSDYDPGSGAKPNDFNWALSYIPKSMPSIDKGGGIYVPIVRFIDSASVKITAKTLYVDNASFTGDVDNSNSTIETDDVCLRYVYEF